MKSPLSITFLIAAILGLPALLHAQADNQTAIEGYVFDSSEKPVANVIVSLTSANADDQSIVGTIATQTNASGFYQLQTYVDPAATNTLSADCTTSRGIAVSQLPFYTPARPIVYRRDFYLTLPRKLDFRRFLNK
jgi:hypothetical protein